MYGRKRGDFDWINTSFFVAIHVLAATGIFYSISVRFSWWNVALAVLWYLFSGLSITGGYHRLFAHKSYQCNTLLSWFYLLFGAAAVQNSVVDWVSDHRRHHAHTDDDHDPYNIIKGFLWAHIGWVLSKRVRLDYSNVSDLLSNRLVRFQHRYYVLLALFVGGIIPVTIGLLWGDPLGAFFWAVSLRLVAQYHATFSVNSIAHYFGRQPYSKRNSARDSALTALITLGEGYHNFHHRFPSDYRNGVRKIHYDPTKWWLWALSKLGVTWNLRQVTSERIQAARRETI